MTGYLTKDEYETFTKLQDKFCACLEQCGIEIFVMQHNQGPGGKFCSDYEVYDTDKYMVQFETWSCGESDRDTIYVPIRYIYDEGYREYYDKHLENENCRKEARKEAETQRLKDARAEEKEIHDRAEYERLKKKYEGI